MLQKEIKVGLEILSPYDTIWMIIKKYAGDMILIKRKHDELVCILTGGQFRDWKIVKNESKNNRN